MIAENQLILDYLQRERFSSSTKLEHIYKTFKECSKDDANKRYLVTSQVKAIKFEKLTEWICANNRKAADAMTFTDSNIILIEFKAGDRTKGPWTKEKLIKSVIGKINDSDTTIYHDIVDNIDKLNSSDVRIAFYLVVDAVEMGIDSRSAVLLRLALGSQGLQDEKLEYLINQLLPVLKDSTSNPEHFAEIDIWYSDIFDTYLQEYGIVDISMR